MGVHDPDREFVSGPSLLVQVLLVLLAAGALVALVPFVWRLCDHAVTLMDVIVVGVLAAIPVVCVGMIGGVPGIRGVVDGIAKVAGRADKKR